jgi:hypothetical protein
LRSVFVSIQLPARFCPLAHVYSGFDFLVKLMSFLLRLFHSLGRSAPRPIFSCVIFVQSVQSSRRFFVSVFTPASLSTPEHASCLSVKETLLVFDFLLRGKSSAPSSFGSALRARAGPRAGFDFAADNLFFCSRVHVCHWEPACQSRCCSFRARRVSVARGSSLVSSFPQLRVRRQAIQGQGLLSE